MPRFSTIQQRFTQGELDPIMLGRDDIDQYYGALARALDVFTLPQGGFKRRPGLEHIDRILGVITKESSTGTTPNTGSIGTTNPYVSHQEDIGSLVDMGVIYLDNVSISTGTSDEFFLQVSTDAASWVTVGEALSLSTTAKDFTRRVHGNYRYARLARIGTTDLGSATVTVNNFEIASESGLSNTRCIEFEFNVDQTYKIVVSDKNLAFYQGNTYLIDIYAEELTSARLPAIDWENNADTLLVFHEDVQTLTFQRQSANDEWTKSVVTYTNIPQFDFGSGNENLWSSSRGWPRHGRFYQRRLWVDGGKGRPSVVYGSVVNDFFSFDFGTSLDDEAVGPLSDGFDDVEAIYPGRNLMIFTSNREYIIPQTFGDPITPTTAAMSGQSSIGHEPGFRPQEVEGGVMYVQRQGASIQEFIYDDAQQAFSNNFVSILSSHLVVDPQDFALRKATSTEDGAYLLLVRGDGGLTVANILRNQGITSFVDVSTDGNFKSCGVDVDDMYFVIEREINGESVNYLERFNNDHFLDVSTRFTISSPTNVVTGLDHLEGETVTVYADESLLGDETVTNGQITIDRNAEETLEVGINFTPRVKDLPAAQAFQNEATLMGRKTNISEVSLRLKDTVSISVDGKPVNFRSFGPSGGGSPLNQKPVKFTGVKRLLGFSGWNEDAQIEITQPIPGPMQVLAIKKRINT